MILKLFYSLFSSSSLIHKYFTSFGYKYWRASLFATCGQRALTIFTWSAFKSLSCPITCCAIFLAWYLALVFALNVSLFSCLHFLVFSFVLALFFFLVPVPPPALLTFLFVFQTPFLVQHGLPFFIFRFGVPFSLAFLSFFFLLLAQVLPQFTAQYGHDELMSLCNKHNHHCVVKIPPCSSWATKIAPLQWSELEKATQDVNAVALRSYKVLSSPILISQVKAHWHIIYQASIILVLGYRDHMLKTINPSVVRGLCDWTVELANFMNKPLYFYDLMYEEWLWGSPLNGEFVQVEGMHELKVSPPLYKTTWPLWERANRPPKCK